VARGISAHLGLNAVDPVHYRGRSGRLTACEFDANDMAAIASSAGFETNTLLTSACTRVAVKQLFARAISLLNRGDMFFLTYSGHGGQLPDYNADETDFKDETWCLYDGQWIDDETYSLLRQFSSGVRILLISDSCHSGTGWKNLLMQEGDLVYRAMPNDVGEETYRCHKAFYDAIFADRNLRVAQSQ
jgi:metacaspase-1